MPQVWRSGYDSRNSIATPAIGRLAKRHWGVVSWPQLRELGYGKSAVNRLVARGYLVRLHPAVYAVGHEPLRIEGRLLAALFHAGEGSALSHTTAAWWWRLIDAVPTTIHVSTRHRPTPAKDLKIHRPRQVEAVTERRLSVTGVEQTLIDIAAMLETRPFRRALAEADHRNLLDPPAVTAKLRSGLPGGRAVRHALAHHLPQLAGTDNDFEADFLFLVEGAGLAMPEPNVYVEGFKVDAFWPDHKLVVELNGHATHANPVANENDRARELKLRAAGYRVVRYTWQQVYNSPRKS